MVLSCFYTYLNTHECAIYIFVRVCVFVCARHPVETSRLANISSRAPAYRVLHGKSAKSSCPAVTCSCIATRGSRRWSIRNVPGSFVPSKGNQSHVF